MSDDTVFQPQVIHETARAVVIGPLLNYHQLADAVGSAMSVTAVFVFIVFKDAIIGRVAVKPVQAFRRITQTSKGTRRKASTSLSIPVSNWVASVAWPCRGTRTST